MRGNERINLSPEGEHVVLFSSKLPFIAESAVPIAPGVYYNATEPSVGDYMPTRGEYAGISIDYILHNRPDKILYEGVKDPEMIMALISFKEEIRNRELIRSTLSNGLPLDSGAELVAMGAELSPTLKEQFLKDFQKVIVAGRHEDANGRVYRVLNIESLMAAFVTAKVINAHVGEIVDCNIPWEVILPEIREILGTSRLANRLVPQERKLTMREIKETTEDWIQQGEIDTWVVKKMRSVRMQLIPTTDSVSFDLISHVVVKMLKQIDEVLISAEKGYIDIKEIDDVPTYVDICRMLDWCIENNLSLREAFQKAIDKEQAGRPNRNGTNGIEIIRAGRPKRAG